MSGTPSAESMLERERIANRPKHWVRVVTACNSRCLFCLDSDTPRNVFLPVDEVKAELHRGLEVLGADKVILSGGEASLHPEFQSLIRYAKSIGYDRVQTVTNGWRYAEREFMDGCLEAGLGEITFSLHGHTPELHDHLTQHPDSFRNLIKGLMRALRDGRPIVNVDVVINKQNVGVLDRIIELCLSLGVSEFDLLHVIPQAAAYDNRDDLFYDVREHLPVLQKVFRLNRHPGVTVWTNRFPVSFLEGMEDLIQDPHKMLDEVNGRRFQVRRYLDLGAPLDCREPERCKHCFIEPFCTTTDRIVSDINKGATDVWWVGSGGFDGDALPLGCDALGVAVTGLPDLNQHYGPAVPGLYATVDEARPWPAGLAPGGRLTLVATTAEQLDCWLTEGLPRSVQIEVQLNQATAPWLLAHRDRVGQWTDRLRIHQPSHEHMAGARRQDVRAPREFFVQLGLPVHVSGLPACLAPGAVVVESVKKLEAELFDEDSGRLQIRELAAHHISQHYRAKSVRCDDCILESRCDGAHINLIRDQGLTQLTPFVEGTEAEQALAQAKRLHPQPILRVANGRPPEPAPPSLGGQMLPTEVPRDPLALVGEEQLLKKKRRDELLSRVESHR